MAVVNATTAGAVSLAVGGFVHLCLYRHGYRAIPNIGPLFAANVLANNLGANNPNITTPAILSGLQSGKSIGQTLQSLGLSASEAKQARRTADRQAKDGETRVKNADKRAKAEKSKRLANEKMPDSR